MTNADIVKGILEIREDDWFWTPDSLKKQNVSRLTRDLKFVSRVNPATGVTFRRHLRKAEGCSAHLEDPAKFAKCVIEMNKL
jgi:hypothetical protein